MGLDATAPNIYDFRGAIGIDADANGLLYVTDTGNDRIQVFNPNLGRQYEQTAPPTPAVTTPAQSANLPPRPGDASAARRPTTSPSATSRSRCRTTRPACGGTPANQSWEAGQDVRQRRLVGRQRHQRNWRWIVPRRERRQGRYLAELRTRDHNANFSQTVVRTLRHARRHPAAGAEPPVADNIRPTAQPVEPDQGEIVLTGAPIDVHGHRHRRRRRGQVRVAIKNLDNGRYLGNPDSTSSNSFSHDLHVADRHADDAGRADDGLDVHLATRRRAAGATARPSSR